MILAFIDFISILPFAAFAAMGIAAWVFADSILNRKTRTDLRLEELRNRTGGNAESGGKTSQGIARIMAKASPALSKPLRPKTEKETGKLQSRLNHGGFRSDNAAPFFLTLKIVSLGIGLFMGGGTFLIVKGITTMSLLQAIMIGGLMFYLPDIILGLLSKRRKEKIFLGLPDALDLMVVCVEAGLGLDQAMRKVADEMQENNTIIAYEFGTCNMQLQMGRSREDVLRELGDRSGVDDLKALASIIIQADKFGSSIAKALRVQSDSMRVKRRQLAEEKAAKTAVKLIFPLVLFIFPGIFVVLVGPAAITMINEMLPAFQK